MTSRYLVAGCTPWAKRIFDKTLSKYQPGAEWWYVETPDELVNAVLGDTDGPTPWPPYTYIFFLHWRWKVPAEIVNKYPCIGFHLGRFPDERGGSPLQHRIIAEQEIATLTMFRMTEKMDDGPVLHEESVSLDGSAEAIYHRAMERAAGQIDYFLTDPEFFKGRDWTHTDVKPRTYERRTPDESELWSGTLPILYDRIRMVDAEGYPRAFLNYQGFRFTFYQAVMYDGKIRANVEITEVDE